jgi:alkylation response protein AidB-like acyl-CoA dehydrogenase
VPDARPVHITPSAEGTDERLSDVAREARARAGADVTELLQWAVGIGAEVARPGSGATAHRWELMATVAAQDLTLARVLEPHLDAVAILAESGQEPAPSSSWGVWAAEGPAARLVAHADAEGRWVLTGRKPWCSLAGSVSHGLVTAWVGDDERRLFAVELAHPGITVEEATWVPSGLSDVITTPVTMDQVDGIPVGATGWYLQRDGFWWGGIGVAAIWYGGAVGLARRLASHVASRRPDQLSLMHLGEVDAALGGARSALAEAAIRVDDGSASGPGAALLAARVRHIVASAVEDVQRHVAHAMGPGPLSQEPEHVARVADLALYVRQHHAERDAAALGRMLLENDEDYPPW